MKPKLLDLFCGAGGAATGLYRAGFEVTGVDIKPQPHYPFTFIQDDALTYPLEGYDAYWASPPCQAYVDTNKNRETKHPKLIEPTRKRLKETGKPYIIENVIGAPYLLASLMLCGTMFGLPLFRHRYFELSWPGPLSPYSCYHWGQVAKGEIAHVVNMHPHGTRMNGVRGKAPECKIPWSEAMGIDWMTKQELTQAIPPAYAEYIGKYLMSLIMPPEVLGLGYVTELLCAKVATGGEKWDT